jgi:hypothetical protein
LISFVFVAFPAGIFYTLLARKAFNLPNLDDYNAVLDFLNQMGQLKGLSAKASWFFTAQLGEFKLLFLHALACAQLSLLGHIDLWMLGAIANGFILLLALLFWKMFLPESEDLSRRLAFCIPASWLLFQLGYWDDLNWATPGLQHVAVLMFAFYAFWLLLRKERWAYGAALACLALAVASDGNGLLVIPIGILILGARRQYVRIAGWLIASAALIAAYFWHYTVVQPPSGAHRSVVSVLLQMKPGNVLMCMGNAVCFILPFPVVSLLLGILLCIFFAWMIARGYIQKNPCICCCVLFLVLTVTGIAGLRSDYGVTYLFVPRYTIYSILLLIFAWFAFVEEFLQYRNVSLIHNGAYLGAVAAAVVFSLLMDLLGYDGLERRERILVQAMTQFEHPSAEQPDPFPSPAYVFPSSDKTTNPFGLQIRFREILRESMKDGIYTPPRL